MSLRDWLWWPTVPTHAVACGIAFLVVTFLGIAQIPQFPNFKVFTAVQASASGFFGMSALIAAFNACVLFLHARGDYLTAASGLRPIGLTFILLAVAFPLAWGGYRVLGNGAAPPDIHALASGVALWAHGAARPPAVTLECTRVLRGVFVGEGGFAMVLLFSVLWRAPPQDTLELTAAWSRTQPLVRRVFFDEPLLSVDEHERLEALLKVLAEGATKLDTRVMRQRDLDYAKELAAAAATVQDAVHGPHGSLENLRRTKDAKLLAAVRLLLGEGQQ
jgi:hypothetical protein